MTYCVSGFGSRFSLFLDTGTKKCLFSSVCAAKLCSSPGGPRVVAVTQRNTELFPLEFPNLFSS